MSTGEEEEMASRRPEPGRRRSGDLPDSTTGDRPGMSDSPLVQRAVTCAKEGDSEGLHFLYVRYAPDVLDHVAGFTHDHHEAEDITQGVFTELGAAINWYERREGPFAAWILRVAHIAALDHRRRGRSDDPHRDR